MLYYLLRPLVKIAAPLFFSKIHLLNKEQIPKDGAVIFALNHPTAFLETCMLAILLSRPLYFLVRGDFFRKPLIGSVLRSLHLIPIFRQSDGGLRERKKNFASLAYCSELLLVSKAIVVLPEGTAKPERRLRPLQKGISRIAFNFSTQHPNLKLYIVPVGVSYSTPTQARGDIFLSCGTPIAIHEGRAETLPAFDRQLRTQLELRLKKNMLYIDNPNDDLLAEYLLKMGRSTFANHQSGGFIKQQNMLNRINTLQLVEKQLLTGQLLEYKTALADHRIMDATLVKKRKGGFLGLALLLTAIPVVFGFFFSLIPCTVAKRLVQRRISRPEFFAPVFFFLLLFSWVLYGLGWFLLALISTNWAIFAVALGLVLLAYGFLYWKKGLEDYLSLSRYRQLSKAKRVALLQKRKAIMACLEFDIPEVEGGPIKNILTGNVSR